MNNNVGEDNNHPELYNNIYSYQDRTNKELPKREVSEKVSLVSFGNTTLGWYRSELHSANKHLKCYLLIIWPTHLTKPEFRFFTRWHFDVVILTFF